MEYIYSFFLLIHPIVIDYYYYYYMEYMGEYGGNMGGIHGNISFSGESWSRLYLKAHE